MKHLARIARYRSLRESPLWKLLAADHAPEVIGLLQSLLLDGERLLPAAVLHERLQRMLDELNAEQLARDLPRTAQAYVAHWLARAGWSVTCPRARSRSSSSCPPRPRRRSASSMGWSTAVARQPRAGWRW